MAYDSTTSQSLHTRDGRRKYVTSSEREHAIAAAWAWSRPEVGTLCLMLAYSGCRISEALALVPDMIDPDQGLVTIRSLKKRGVIHYRQVPMPLLVIAAILETAGWQGTSSDRIWPLSRGRAWELLKGLMGAAGIRAGPHMTPKGLRHGFGVHAVLSGVPLHLLQRWLGHARLSTTAIYADVVGPEERFFAERMWKEPNSHPATAPTSPCPGNP